MAHISKKVTEKLNRFSLEDIKNEASLYSKVFIK